MTEAITNEENKTGDVQNKDSEYYSSQREFHKSMYEYWKHLSTLSTGSIVLLGAFLEKLFPQPKWKFMVIVAIGGFLVTVVASVVAYSMQVLNYPRPGLETEEWEWNTIYVATIITWLGFMAGIISLAVFVVRNFY